MERPSGRSIPSASTARNAERTSPDKSGNRGYASVGGKGVVGCSARRGGGVRARVRGAGRRGCGREAEGRAVATAARDGEALAEAGPAAAPGDDGCGLHAAAARLLHADRLAPHRNEAGREPGVRAGSTTSRFLRSRPTRRTSVPTSRGGSARWGRISTRCARSATTAGARGSTPPARAGTTPGSRPGGGWRRRVSTSARATSGR